MRRPFLCSIDDERLSVLWSSEKSFRCDVRGRAVSILRLWRPSEHRRSNTPRCLPVVRRCSAPILRNLISTSAGSMLRRRMRARVFRCNSAGDADDKPPVCVCSTRSNHEPLRSQILSEGFNTSVAARAPTEPQGHAIPTHATGAERREELGVHLAVSTMHASDRYNSV